MKDQNFERAASRLLEKLSLGNGEGAVVSVKEIKKALRGSGIHIKHVKIVNGLIPNSGNILGGILNKRNGVCLPFLVSNQNLMTLADGNIPSEEVDEKNVKSYDDAWLLEEKKFGFDAISPFLRKYGSSFSDLIICALIINLFALVFPLFSSFVYDKILGNNIVETLWALTVCLLMVMGIEFCMRAIRVSAAERFAVGSETDIDYEIFRKLLDSNANALPSIGTLLEKYKQIISYRDFLSSSYLMSLADFPFMIIFLAAIGFIGGPMILIAVVLGMVMTVSNILFMKPILQYDMIAKKNSERRFGLMTDLLSAREAIIGSAFRKELQRRFRQFSIEAAIHASRSRYWRGLSGALSNCIAYLSYISVLVAGVYMVEMHQLTSGGLLAVSMLTSRTMSGVSSVSSLLVRYREFRTALREMNNILPETEVGQRVSHGKLNGGVYLDNVTCKLRSSGTPVLNNISLSIQTGELVGIAGAPGAGKTTLLRLLAGVIRPDGGRILVDNIPLETLSHEDISDSIGYKPQDLCLIDGTVEDNVRGGRPLLSSEQRREILTKSGLSFLFKESGIDWKTEIGMRGTRLSGGQRQIISIARAMLSEPSILLLDEPTNGLDANLESMLAKQIELMRGKATILISTHSHGLLSICDRIIVVGQSKILADGPREKVMIKNG